MTTLKIFEERLEIQVLKRGYLLHHSIIFFDRSSACEGPFQRFDLHHYQLIDVGLKISLLKRLLANQANQ
jgi:hypothetical protein